MSTWLLIGLFLGLTAFSTVAAGGLRPTDLRCEYHTDPAGIDETAPRLSWKLETSDPTRRGQSQSAYQIVAASSPDTLDAADLWDSGKIASDATNQIVYAGKPVTSRQRVWWRVRAWDERGAASPWSAPARWSMGLLDAGDWSAKWVGYDDDEPASGEPTLKLPAPPQLRKAFASDKPVRRATLYATALGLYDLHLNGRRVGGVELAPGWTDYRKRVYYHTYDATDLVRGGENVIGTVLADGWYAGYVGFGGRREIYGDKPRLMAQLEIEYDDGTTQTVATDASWKAAYGPTREADLLMGCAYDARRESGWMTAGFDDAAWRPVAVDGDYKGLVQAYPGAAVRRQEADRQRPASARRGRACTSST